MTGPEPGSAPWTRLVTASKVPSILGLAPEGWDTPWSMWHAMKGLIPADTRNMEGKSRGHYLENGIIDWWLDQHPTAGGSRQVWHPVEDWAGATSDWSGHQLIADDPHDTERVVLNAKTSADLADWWTRDGDDVTLYPPAYYLASLLWEMWCAGAQAGYVALLGPKLRFQEWRVDRDDALIDGIVARCREFYDSLAGDVPPDLDDTPATYEAVRRLHPDIDDDLVVELDGRVAVEFVAAVEAADAAERRKRAATARVLDAMGRARVAEVYRVQVARRQPGRYGASFVPVARQLSELGV